MEDSEVPPAKRQKLTEASESQPSSEAPSVLLQLPKYVQQANEEELVHLKEKHGIVAATEEAKAVTVAQPAAEAAPSSNKPFLKRKTGLVFGYLGEKYQVRVVSISKWSRLLRNPYAHAAFLCRFDAFAFRSL